MPMEAEVTIVPHTIGPYFVAHWIMLNAHFLRSLSAINKDNPLGLSLVTNPNVSFTATKTQKHYPHFCFKTMKNME